MLSFYGKVFEYLRLVVYSRLILSKWLPFNNVANELAYLGTTKVLSVFVWQVHNKVIIITSLALAVKTPFTLRVIGTAAFRICLGIVKILLEDEFEAV